MLAGCIPQNLGGPIPLFVLTRFRWSACVDDAKNSLLISRGALAPGLHRRR